MGNKVKTEYIKFDKINSLGSYVNLSNTQKEDIINQLKQRMVDKQNDSDVVENNKININPEIYDDIDRYNSIRKLLPIQSDMWDWYTNFIGDNICIEIDYINKTVKVVNNPETNDINVKYVISRHPVEDLNEISSLEGESVTFNIEANQDTTLVAQLDRVGNVLGSNQNSRNLLGNSIVIDTNVTNKQTVSLKQGSNQITFKGVSTGKYQFTLKNLNGRVEYQKDITYLDGKEQYDGNVEILDYVVSGYILDSATNQPISGAIVDVFSNGDIWKSDPLITTNDGFYTVSIDRDVVEQQGINQFTVRVSADNYVGKLETVDVVVGNINISQNVLLIEGDPTPKVLSITWIDEAEDIYTSYRSPYKEDKEAIERYIYKYGLIQFDPDYGSWSGAQNSYKALIYESEGMPANIEYSYLADRASNSNWNTLFETYKNVFIKLIKNYPSAQNLKVGLFIDNSGSLETYEVFYGLSSSQFNNTYTRETVNNISNQYVKEFCNWIFDNYTSVTSITLNNADNERWINWTIDFINQMEEQ